MLRFALDVRPSRWSSHLAGHVLKLKEGPPNNKIRTPPNFSSGQLRESLAAPHLPTLDKPTGAADDNPCKRLVLIRPPQRLWLTPTARPWIGALSWPARIFQQPSFMM